MMPKSAFAAVLWAAAAAGALIAWLAQRRGGVCLKLANAFSGGALLSAGLIHLLADATKEAAEAAAGEERYPWPELLCGLGCLLTHGFEALAEGLWPQKRPVAQPASQKTVANVAPPQIVGAI